VSLRDVLSFLSKANATGIFLITAVVGQKRLEILRELNPKASAVALLVNPVAPALVAS
jgi:hypothetical protein